MTRAGLKDKRKLSRCFSRGSTLAGYSRFQHSITPASAQHQRKGEKGYDLHRCQIRDVEEEEVEMRPKCVGKKKA